ncbi:MAG: fumarylacetoacetate hydrolase family protein [Pseudomonadota bacterium]
MSEKKPLHSDDLTGCFVGRVWRPDLDGPSIVVAREGQLIDITSPLAPTMSELLALDDPAGYVAEADGTALGSLDEIAGNSIAWQRTPDRPYLIAPNDLQAIKAAGVTFVTSMLERVIEEQAGGKPERAASVRAEITQTIGTEIGQLKPGSPEAAELKALLISKGLWSQYLEVGIGPDAEVFTKSQVMSAVGYGADIGVHPISSWNNPEPEVVLAVSSSGEVVGATLGNDVNLRDVEGRSALLLGKAKDNNASCAIGPFIRLFDDAFTIDHVRTAELTLSVDGPDGYRLEGASSMSEISRDPLDLVSQTIGPHHDYPDGFVLFLGTLFAPVEDRDEEGQGFTHKMGDIVTVEAPGLGRLVNRVRRTDECDRWTFGTRRLMQNLSQRGLLS